MVGQVLRVELREGWAAEGEEKAERGGMAARGGEIDAMAGS